MTKQEQPVSEETSRTKKTVHADDYTVGWICALPKEALPASLLLDEEYDTILDDPADLNAYSFGRMGDHNVVIAILPKGTYGQVQAAVVGTNLFRSFLSIRFCFLVGIGAGIPSEDCDIHLGDVVVSAPDGGTGAFVQFDFGSQNADGSFRLKSRPISPPVFLLNAVSKFETDNEQGNAPLSRYISDVEGKQEHLRARFQYPGTQHDHLFPPEYTCQAAKSGGVCRGCDRSYVDSRRRQGPRPSTMPVVHYGVIASGGKLVRDPFLRDHLMNTYKARCIEMEAGGIINNMDCLVIRGVSDYADSHKNDIWHDYAALTASACAKAILGYVHPVPAQGSRKAMEARRKIEEAKRRHQAVVDYLAPYDFSKRYVDVLSQRHENTGKWFLETAAFQKWLANQGRTLWSSGMPGAGKSVLLATAIHHAQSLFARQADVAVIFAFCDNRDTANKTGENMIASLWRQLVKRRILSEVECADLEASYVDAGIRPTASTLLGLLSSEMRRYRRVFIFLDALDELTVKHRDSLMFLLREIPLHRSLFLTSRFLDSEYPLPGEGDHIEIRAREEDLWAYIDGRIQESSRLRAKVHKDRKLRGQIRGLITQKAGGMFLLARLHTETIENKYTIRDIVAALENLPEGRNAITETYDNAMQRIKDQSAPDRELAEKTILWISHIRQPLTLRELQCALTLREGDTTLDFDDLIPGELLVSTCAGLVHVEKETNRLQFVHSTAQEYILATKSSQYPDCDAQLAHTCIQFLSLDMFRMRHDGLTAAQFRDIIPTFPFLPYAACHWGFHARVAAGQESRPSLRAAILRFTDLNTHFAFALRVLLGSISRDRGSQWGLEFAKQPDAVKPMNAFAYFGLDFLLNELLNTNEVALTSSQDGILGNVLHWASLGGNESTLRLLLGHRVVSTIIDEALEGYTPLHLSAELRKEVSANLLLDYGANISARSALGSTAFHLAAQHGLGSIVQRALSNENWREVVLTKNIFGRTVLHDSVVPGNAPVIATLLQILDTQPVSTTLHELHDNLQRNPLHVIAESGFADVCRLLLASRYGSRLAMSRDSGGRTPLHVAIAQGRDKVVEEFIHWDGGRLFAQIPETQAALLLAARSGQPLVVSALLNSSHKLALLDSNGMTVLHHAATSGDVETVRIVLDKVRRISMLEATNALGNTPLFCASERGHAEVVEYLIQEGRARVNAINNDGQQPLHGAARSNLANVVRILLASGADVPAQDLKGQTALAVAAQHRALDVAALLLAAGAQLRSNSRDSGSHHWLQTHFGQLVEQRRSTRMGITDEDALGNLYPPQRPKDQFKVYYSLKTASGQRLPPHLISYILDLAEYWLVSRTQRSEVLMITELEFYNTPYLRSAPITGNPECPVRRIEFDITSHDQGWADTPRGGWPYDHSHTWFEASRESKQGTTMDKAPSHLSGPEIVKNVRASHEWKRHHVFWPESLVRAFDYDGDGPGDNNEQQSATEFYVDPVDNPPILLKWICEIQQGDRVCVHMRARFPGWQNYVRQAELTIYTSCLLPPATRKRLAGVV